MGMNLPGLGELPADQVRDIQSEIGTRILFTGGLDRPDPGRCLASEPVPVTREERRFNLDLVSFMRG